MSNTTITEKATKAILSIRTSRNPNHHLWFNNGTWWVHYTQHLSDFTKKRVRRSLHTRELGIARVLRDSLLHDPFANEEEIPREAVTALAA
jgi:hypothetical protein